MQRQFDIPVVFIIFNRIDTTKKVFEAIKGVMPSKLYLISDGYREDVPGEKTIVEEVRQYVENSISWECDVHKNYAEKNIGCGKRISTGLDWVFEQEEMAIILEDDCLPDHSFFSYCEELLNRYKDNEDIMLIGGNNPIVPRRIGNETYTFCKIPFIWGWATWRRAWKKFDFSINSWPQKKHDAVWKKVFTKKAYCYYMSQFDVIYRQEFNVWDYQMVYAVISNEMLCIVPWENHVMNLGFDIDATNTKTAPKWLNNRVTPISFPIKHPGKIEWNYNFDYEYMNNACWNGYIVFLKKLLGLDINKKYL